MNIINHVSFLDIKDKKILLCVSKGKTKWQLPGGKLDPGETDEQALIRECNEELNIDIDVNSIKYVDSIEGKAHSKDIDVTVIIKIYTANFSGVITPNNEIDKVEYLSYEEVPDTSDLGWEFLNKLKQQDLIV